MAPLPWFLGYSLQRRQPSPLPLPLRFGGGWAAKVGHPFRRLPVASAAPVAFAWVPDSSPLTRFCISCGWGLPFLRLWALAGSWSRILDVVRPGVSFPSSLSGIHLLPSITPIWLPTCRQSLLGLWPCPT